MSGYSLAQVPEKWAANIRPFLQRADEFEKQQPVVSYFLRTHVAFLCMKKTKDKESMKFLKHLLDSLENDKKLLGKQIENVDGRVLLTKYALMLFVKADDNERSGKANLDTVRMFFTSALLFEATTQFTDDGEMDSTAKEKHKYAKYTASRMKKALDANEPYKSHNPIEEAPPRDDSSRHNIIWGSKAAEDHGGAPFLPSPPAGDEAVRPPPEQTPPVSFSNLSPPPPNAFGSYGKGGFDDNNRVTSHQSTPLAPPAYDALMYSQPMPEKPSFFRPVETTTTTTATTTAMLLGGKQHSAKVDLLSSDGAVPALALDAILDAQKFITQAVNALQFMDHENARKFLVKALEILDQQS